MVEPVALQITDPKKNTWTLVFNSITGQADIIDGLSREVILVPDADKTGKKLIEAALEYGWSVSFPVWQQDYKDVNEAVMNLGKLLKMLDMGDR